MQAIAVVVLSHAHNALQRVDALIDDFVAQFVFAPLARHDEAAANSNDDDDASPVVSALSTLLYFLNGESPPSSSSSVSIALFMLIVQRV
jgi:hypothetical protein